jgi:hypothetical protein
LINDDIEIREKKMGENKKDVEEKIKNMDVIYGKSGK